MEYALVFILTVLTVIFWSGKGSWLIAGYNTMNDKEKQKTDRKKLCRVAPISPVGFLEAGSLLWSPR